VKHSKRRVLTQAHIVNIEHPIKHIPRRGRHTTLIKTFLGLPIRPVVLGPKCAAWVPVSCPHTSHASSRRWVRQSAVWRVIPGRGVRRTAQKRLQEGCQHDLIPVDIQQKRASGDAAGNTTGAPGQTVCAGASVGGPCWAPETSPGPPAPRATQETLPQTGFLVPQVLEICQRCLFPLSEMRNVLLPDV